MRVEDLEGLHGIFEGVVIDHPNKKLTRVLAVGKLTYTRNMDGVSREVAVPVQGVTVKRLQISGSDFDFRRYIQLKRGPRGKQENIFAVVDK